jgi:hypothetical protein
MDNPPAQSSAPVGLCADCQHAQPMKSDRGSFFLRCQLSLTDHRFPRYPRLPVLSCGGYKKKEPESARL